jgi:hypothetical protein
MYVSLKPAPSLKIIKKQTRYFDTACLFLSKIRKYSKSEYFISMTPKKNTSDATEA